MKTILTACLLIASTAALACPSANDASSDKYGNAICVGDQGQMTAILGSLKNCPTSYYPNTDRYGNHYCGYKDKANNDKSDNDKGNNDIRAYDLSSGCLSFMMPDTDKFGNELCNLNGKPVVAIIKDINAAQLVTFGSH